MGKKKKEKKIKGKKRIKSNKKEKKQHARGAWEIERDKREKKISFFFRFSLRFTEIRP